MKFVKWLKNKDLRLYKYVERETAGDSKILGKIKFPVPTWMNDPDIKKQKKKAKKG